MKKTVMIALVILAVVYVAAFAIVSVASNPVSTELIRNGSLEDSVQVDGIVVREEWVYTAESGGVFEGAPSEGDRVTVGQTLGTVYFGEMVGKTAAKLNSVNQEIARLEQQEQTVFGNLPDHPETINAKIDSSMEELIASSANGDGETVSRLWSQLSQLHDRKMVLEGKKADGSGELDRLYREKTELETGLRSQTLIAQQSGIFSYHTDGFENLIGVSSLRGMKPGDVDALLDTDIAEASETELSLPVAKVINNFKWYLVFNLTVAQLDTLKEGDEVALRFGTDPTVSYPAKIATVSSEQNGRVCVSVSCMTDIALNSRKVRAELIKAKYDGYCFSRAAVRMRDDVSGVYVIKNGTAVFCPIKILYGTEDTVVVSNQKSADNQVALFDEIINAKTNSIREGELLR